MADAPRTRSQLTLPDNIFSDLQRSPLKDARSALRNHAQNAVKSSDFKSGLSQPKDALPGGRDDTGDESDDAILLSPGKNQLIMSKRSASPESHANDAPRKAKKVRRDGEDADEANRSNEENVDTAVLEEDPTAPYARSKSESRVLSPSRKRSATPFASSPHTTSRSKSHPPFPPSTTKMLNGAPRLDLSALPPSPTRSAPFQFRPLPKSQVASTSHDSENPGMSEPSSGNQTEPTAASATPRPLDGASDQFTHQGTSNVSLSRPEPQIPRVDFSAMPYTPRTKSNADLLFGLSPLTPMPPTPLLMASRTSNLKSDIFKAVGSESRSQNGVGWIPEEEEEDSGEASESRKPPQLPKPAAAPKSKLPRPSSTVFKVPLAPTSSASEMPPPTIIPSSSRTATYTSKDMSSRAVGNVVASRTGSQPGQKAPQRVVDKGKAKAEAAVASGKPNAFDLMMKSNGTAPGKGKISMTSKNGSTASHSSARVSTVPGLGPSTLSGVKGKMRKREKPKQVPKTLPLVPTANDQPEGNEQAATQDRVRVMISADEQPPEPLRPAEQASEIQDIPGPERLAEPEPELVEPADDPMDELFGGPLSPTTTPDEMVPDPPPTSDDIVTPAEEPANDASAEETVLAVPAVPQSSTVEPQVGDVEMADATNPPAVGTTSTSTTAKSPKSHLKRRVPSAAPALARVTRSTSSLKRKADEQPDDEPASKRSLSAASTAGKRTASARVSPKGKGKQKAEHAVEDDSSELSEPPDDTPAKPTRGPSFARPTASSLARTPAKFTSPKKSPSKLPKPVSPVKLGRSSSSSSLEGKTFAKPYYHKGTALYALKNALGKLEAPPPIRPNTSMGFEPTAGDTSDEEAEDSTQSAGPSTAPVRKSRTLDDVTGAGATEASSSMAQRPSAFMNQGRTGNIFSGGAVMRGGMNGRGRAPKASRNPGLAMVVGSPVKGGSAAMNDDEDMDMDIVLQRQEGDKASQDTPQESNGTAGKTPEDLLDIYKHKAKPIESFGDGWKLNAARRASLASQALSQSLSALPVKSPPSARAPGLMGPPATPPRREGLRPLRSSSSTYPSSGGADGAESSKAAEKKKEKEKKPTLDVLKGCRVFVDVRDPEGSDLGDFYREMLQDLGARVMASAGQTCTHIVYRNGLNSTLKRWKMMPEPKPHVVAMAWVIECAEKQAHVDESEFLVDLSDVTVGTNRRRKSMIPKLIRDWDETSTVGDVSMGESNTSMSMDDDLPPLERARRRLATISS